MESDLSEGYWVVEIIGISGSGKTTLINAIKDRNGVEIVRPIAFNQLKISYKLIPYIIIGLYLSVYNYLANFILFFLKKKNNCEQKLDFNLIKSVQICKSVIKIGWFVIDDGSRPKKNMVYIYDQGVIYEISFLMSYFRVFSPLFFLDFINMSICRISKIYSFIVFLDYKSTIVLERMKKRKDWSKYLDFFASESRVILHVDRYYESYKYIFSKFNKDKYVINTLDFSKAKDCLIRFVEKKNNK